MAVRRYEVYIGLHYVPFGVVQIEMFEEGRGLIGVNHSRTQKHYDAPVGYQLLGHLATYKSCYEHWLVTWYDLYTGEVIDTEELTCSVIEGVNNRIVFLDIILDHKHEGLLPEPAPPPVQPPPVPTPPLPLPPPVGPPIEEPIYVDPPPDAVDQPVKGVPPMPPPIVTPPTFIDGPMEPPVRIPPHPGETDRGTLLRFAARWGGQIERYAFNVPLDEGEMPEDVEEPFRSMWAKLTQHKADLVFYRKGELYVAEVKPRLSRGAIGEALTAAYMYRRLYNPKERIIPAVICQVAPDLLLQVAAHLGVKVFVTDKIDLLNVAGETRFRWQKRL